MVPLEGTDESEHQNAFPLCVTFTIFESSGKRFNCLADLKQQFEGTEILHHSYPLPPQHSSN